MTVRVSVLEPSPLVAPRTVLTPAPLLLADAEPCIPLPTADFFGIDDEAIHRENAGATVTEYRSACVFLRRIVDKRKRVKACFEGVLSPSPPPPPTTTSDVRSAQWAIDLEEQRRVNGDDAAYGRAPQNEAEFLQQEIEGSIAETRALIDTLGDSNPILRELLSNSIDEMKSTIVRVSDGSTKASDYFGRRLMQRKFEYSRYMGEALVDHPIMASTGRIGYGKVGIPGVDRASCEALCEGLTVTSNASDPANCAAFAFKRADPFSATDSSGRCFLLSNTGACTVESFASQLFTRQIESEEQCHATLPGYDNPICMQLPPSRTDTRVLTHFDATAIAAQTPTPAAPGSGGLPMPGTAIEAGFFVATARAQGLYAFWSGSPDTTNGNVTTHWITEGGGQLMVQQGDKRCILVSSATSSVETFMYAEMSSCAAKLADGVLFVAAAAAPPPPPGGGDQHLFDPRVAPPPPPSIKSHALQIFKRTVVFSLTEAVCSGGIAEGHVHRLACERMLEDMGRWQHVQGVGTISPLCSDYCWHECTAADYTGGQHRDTFDECKQPECAAASCKDFLLAECPPVLHSRVEEAYKTTCSITPPSPPAPPAPPPSPPAPPHSPAPRSPPPYIEFTERRRDTETDSDADCEVVEYAVCVEIVRQYAQKMGAGYSSRVSVSLSHCEGLSGEADCYEGCSFGDRSGGSYRIVPPGTDSRFTKRRCRLASKSHCACSSIGASSPPMMLAPPPPTRYTEEWQLVEAPKESRDSSRGEVHALVQRLVNGRTLDLSLRSGPMHSFACPLEDDGRDTCALTCSGLHLSRLRAFTVTGESSTPPPPSPLPPSSPSSLPPPFQAGLDDRFSPCQDTCTALEEGEQFCRDGGKGSFSPALCSYASSVRRLPFQLPPTPIPTPFNPVLQDHDFPHLSRDVTL